VSARDEILRALGGATGAAPAPPPVYAPTPLRDADLFARFAASLAAAGGTARALEGADALGEALRADPHIGAARQLWSSLAEVVPRHPEGPVRAPHDLAQLDVALLRGDVAVAESGAVWWAPRDALERAAGFLAERVVLVAPRAALVADLHAACARIDVGAQRYGCFVCGPSKTADIEQALVIGAHGPRSLEVWLVGAPA
jgi:L-lactate dehydrogenase complex protein LldG